MGGCVAINCSNHYGKNTAYSYSSQMSPEEEFGPLIIEEMAKYLALTLNYAV